MYKKMTAALLAVCMIVGLMMVPASAASFTDVADDHWAAGAIQRWNGFGVLNGHDDGTFTPEKTMTRAEFAQMLVNLLGLTATSDVTFPDVADDAWYADAIAKVVAAGIMNGSNGMALPGKPISFEEAAVMLSRALGLVKSEDTTGANWSAKTVEVLSGLGMIGEDVDEHLVVGVDCNRAIVAALADSVIGEYVAEDREEPISGEVKGVVLVVKGAKAEIKDAVLTAPVVVDSASVTLTNTEAKDVVVSGKEAKVEADEATKVENVSVAGEAPSVDIKGEVASVTIEEGTTQAVIEAPKAAEDAIVNNSTEEATVNGATVEGKPEEPAQTPDEGNTGDNGDEYTGSVSGGAAGCTHEWVKVGTAVAATCATEGRQAWKCSNCNAEKTETLAKTTTHTYDDPIAYRMVDATNHEKQCSVCGEWASEAHGALTNGACTKNCGYSVTVDESGATIEDGHEHSWTPDAEENAKEENAATCENTGTYTEKCTCGATKTTTIAKLAHTFGAWTVATAAADCKHPADMKRICSVCNAEEHKDGELGAHTIVDIAAVAATCNAEGSTAGKKCSVCNLVTLAPKTLNKLSHNADTTSWAKSEAGHWRACKNLVGDVAHAATAVQAHNFDSDNVCKVCGYAKPAQGGDEGDGDEYPCCEACGANDCSGCTEQNKCTHNGCTECGYTTPAANHEHSYGNWTASADGSKCTRTCSNTDGKCTAVTETTNHTAGQECTNCHTTYTVSAPLGQ